MHGLRLEHFRFRTLDAGIEIIDIVNGLGQVLEDDATWDIGKSCTEPLKEVSIAASNIDHKHVIVGGVSNSVLINCLSLEEALHPT